MLYCHGTEFKYKKQRKYKYYSIVNKINKATYIYVHNGLSSIMKKIVQKWRLLGLSLWDIFLPHSNQIVWERKASYVPRVVGNPCILRELEGERGRCWYDTYVVKFASYAERSHILRRTSTEKTRVASYGRWMRTEEVKTMLNSENNNYKWQKK